MAKAKKDGEFLHCYIKKEIIDQLNDFSEKTGYTKTVIVEKALKEFLEKNKEGSDWIDERNGSRR